MRLSLARLSGHGPGKEFGSFTKSYGFYRVGVASNELNIWKGHVGGMYRSVKEQLRHWWMWAIGGTLTYLAYDSAIKEHERWRRTKGAED